jgi:hypothetical protein
VILSDSQIREVGSSITMYVFFTRISVDEDDVFQCGKCKRQFCSLSAFLGHKQSRCNGPRSILQQTVSRNNQSVQDIVLTTNGRGAAPDSVTASRAPHVIQVYHVIEIIVV